MESLQEQANLAPFTTFSKIIFKLQVQDRHHKLQNFLTSFSSLLEPQKGRAAQKGEFSSKGSKLQGFGRTKNSLEMQWGDGAIFPKREIIF